MKFRIDGRYKARDGYRVDRSTLMGWEAIDNGPPGARTLSAAKAIVGQYLAAVEKQQTLTPSTRRDTARRDPDDSLAARLRRGEKTSVSYDVYKRYLGDARYGQRHRFPKWNIQPTVLQEPRLFPRVFPELTRAEHLRRADALETKLQRIDKSYRRALERGRKAYGTHGALISGGFREHWPEASKEVIRRFAHAESLISQAVVAHRKAAKLRSVKP